MKYIGIIDHPLMLPYGITVEADSIGHAESLLDSERGSLPLSHCYYIVEFDNNSIYGTTPYNDSYAPVTKFSANRDSAGEYYTRTTNRFALLSRDSDILGAYPFSDPQTIGGTDSASASTSVQSSGVTLPMMLVDFDSSQQTIHRLHQMSGSWTIVGGAFDTLGIFTDSDYFSSL